MIDAKEVVSPIATEESSEDRPSEADNKLSQDYPVRCISLDARADRSFSDRPCTQYACKAFSAAMSSPSNGDCSGFESWPAIWEAGPGRYTAICESIGAICSMFILAEAGQPMDAPERVFQDEP